MPVYLAIVPCLYEYTDANRANACRTVRLASIPLEDLDAELTDPSQLAW